MGVPLTAIDNGYVPDNIPPSKHRKSKPKRLFDFEPKESIKTEKIKRKNNNSYGTDASKKDDDDDDLDWL